MTRTKSRRGIDTALVPNTIRAWRLARGFPSQMSLSRASGLSPNAVHRLEAFTIAWTPATLIPLARVLNCKVGDLIDRKPGGARDDEPPVRLFRYQPQTRSWRELELPL
jgi:DNA-binding Xre family transcriptional regulator